MTIEHFEPGLTRMPTAGGADSLLHLLVERVRQAPTAVAQRRKLLGSWNDITWSELAADVAAAANGLARRGVGHGDAIAVLGDARPEFVTLTLAANAVGARVIAAYPAMSDNELESILGNAPVKVVVGATSDDVRRLIDPGLSGAAGFEIDHVPDAKARVGEAFAELLGERPPTPVDWLQRVATERSTAELALSVPTSGVSGTPKRVDLTHANLVSAWRGLLGVLPEISRRDRLVVDAPLAHPTGFGPSLVLPLLTGCVTCFAERTNDVASIYTEVSPTVVISTPTRWTRQARRLRSMMDSTKGLRGVAVRMATQAHGGLRGAIAGVAGRRPILDKIGLAHTRAFVLGWGRGSASSLDLWRSLGLPVWNVYGFAESAGIAAVGDGHSIDEFRVLDGVEVGVDGGELVFAGANVSGAASRDGWVRSGDLGQLADRRVTGVTPAAMSVQATGGVGIAALEDLVKDVEFVREAVALATDQGLVIEIDIDPTMAAAFVSARGVAVSGADLVTNRQAVMVMVETVRAATSASVAGDDIEVRVRREALGISELTATRKLRASYRNRRLAELTVNAEPRLGGVGADN